MIGLTLHNTGERLTEYALLMRLHRPIGILLLAWPMYWALWIAAAGTPDLRVLLVFTVGAVVMRSAGCVINDYADRDFDPHVRRTTARPIATGRVSPGEALWVFGALVALAFALVLLLNPLTIMLAFVAVGLAAGYPFLKRYTSLPQVGLGTAFGWAVPMAFAAQTGAVPPIAWLVFLAAVIWAVVYDTMYAMVDREDDLMIGVKSAAILFGRADRAIIGLLQVLMLVNLVLVGRQAELGLFYYLGLAVAAGLSLYQQWLIRDRDPARCFTAFLNNNWYGLAVFAGLVLDYL